MRSDGIVATPLTKEATVPTLYFTPKACSLAPHILLEESGLPYEAVLVDIFKGENRLESYLRINARARVPAMRLDDGQVLTEVPALLSWISDQVPDRGFFPQAGLARARCMEIVNWLTSSVHPSFGQVVSPHRFSPDAGDHERITTLGLKTFAENLAHLDAMLHPDGPYALGEQYSACDPYLLVFTRCADIIGLDYAHLRRLERCARNTTARPAVQRTLAAEGFEVPEGAVACGVARR